MSAVQPSRHTVGCGGYLFVGPSIFEPCCGGKRGVEQQLSNGDDDKEDGLSLGLAEGLLDSIWSLFFEEIAIFSTCVPVPA